VEPPLTVAFSVFHKKKNTGLFIWFLFLFFGKRRLIGGAQQKKNNSRRASPAVNQHYLGCRIVDESIEKTKLEKCFSEMSTSRKQ